MLIALFFKVSVDLKFLKSNVVGVVGAVPCAPWSPTGQTVSPWRWGWISVLREEGFHDAAGQSWIGPPVREHLSRKN